MSARVLLGLVLFIVIFSAFMIELALSSNTYQQGGIFFNQSNANFTTSPTGLSNVKLCDYSSDIPVLGSLIWGADCVADFTGFLFQFATLNSDNTLIAAVFLAVTVTIIFIAISLIRGGH